MEIIYQVMSKNVDESNLQSMVREVTVLTPSTYPTMDEIKFQSTLKVRATSCVILQIIDKTTYKPITSTNPAWIDDNGVITISAIDGLTASKAYLIRFRLT